MAPRQPATHPIEIFAAGTHTTAAGDELSFSEADLAATAAAYDPAVHEAPLVVGHPKHDGPAYGWVKSLVADGDRLSAIPHQVNAEFAELVRVGSFKKLSAAFYPPKAKANPVPGTYYLRHVGFLGAQPPSLKGLLKPVAFHDAAEDLVTVEVRFSELDDRSLAYRVASGLRAIARIASGLRNRMEAEDVETADWSSIEGITEAARYADPTHHAYSEEISAVTDNTKAQPSPPDAAALDKRERKLAEQEAAFAEREARRDAETAIDALVAEGKVLPRDRDRCIAFMASLDDVDGSLEFAEDGKTVKTSQRGAFKDLLSGLPKIVEFAELTAPEGEAETVAFGAPDGMSVDAAGLALHRKAVAYQHAHANVDYITAVQAVSGRQEASPCRTMP